MDTCSNRPVWNYIKYCKFFFPISLETIHLYVKYYRWNTGWYSTRRIQDSLSINYHCNTYTFLGYCGQWIVLDILEAPNPWRFNLIDAVDKYLAFHSPANIIFDITAKRGRSTLFLSWWRRKLLDYGEHLYASCNSICL